MIVPKMTPKEICDVFYNDLPQIWERISKLDKKMFERTLKKDKTGKGIFFKPIPYKTRNKNDYIIIPFSPGWKNYKKLGLGLVFLMLYQKKNGLHAVLQTPFYRQNDFIIIPPHFFQRYQERFLHRPDLNERETILEFLLRGNFMSMSQHSEKGNFYAVASDGYLLGTHLEDGVHMYKTFLSFDMLKGDQTDKKKLLEDMLCQMESEILGLTL